MLNKKTLLAVLFLVYALARVTANLPALQKPRELADTAAYLRISREPLSSQKFWGDARPFVFPLLLKISSQNVSAAALIQLAGSILAWSFLAWAVSASLRPAGISLFASGVILLLSLTPRIAAWNYVMMTESLSVTLFVLFLSLSVWLLREWQPYKALFLILAAFLLAFTRDTNAYLLLLWAGMFALAAALRWVSPRALVLVGAFLLIFFLNNYTSNLGGRWMFPLNNVVGKRILVNSAAIQELESCGMPVSPALLALADSFANGQDRAFYEAPELKEYRAWLRADGKQCYMKYLLARPDVHVADALTRFEALIRFDGAEKYFARSYDPLIPYSVEPFLYPAYFILPLWVGLTIAALLALWKRAWRVNILWGVFIPLCLTIFPHLFIAWHGDAMAPERHALSVGLQLALSGWLFVFLALEWAAARMRGENYG
ncbi:MAG: hypothetical protein Fur002_20420 [Anaerolineales bacterium]